jgi:hypothetical protein
MQNHPPRPKWNHQAVKAAAAAKIVDDARVWATAMGIEHASPEGAPSEFAALLALAIIESADAYDAGRYLETFYGWPVNGELVRILDTAYMAMPRLTTPFVHEWVMANNIRFPAKKGNTIKFMIGDAEFSGVVVDTLPREARGWVEVLNVKQKGKVVPVDAEAVVKVTSTLDARQPTPPNNNGGGTPVAPRAGAILIEERDKKRAAAA